MYSISVVIPCYNSSQTIVKALDSIFIQKYNVKEVIIIDDGSTDNTISVIEDYINNSTFNNFILIKQPNSGPSVARNKGIKLSTSQWIAFLDSDDEWTVNKLDLQLSILKEDPTIALIGGGHENCFFNKTTNQVVININKLCFKNFFETPTVLVKKDICSLYYFNEKMRFSEDYNLWLQIVSKHKAVYINSVLSKSVLNKRSFGESGLSKNLLSMEKGELKALKNIRKKKEISSLLYLTASLFSMIKFVRRILITKIKSF